MSFEIEGIIHKIFDTKKITDSFAKREFVLKIMDGAYEQLVKFQLTQDRCDRLENFTPGEEVKIKFNLRGREYIKEDKIMYFNSLEVWRIEAINQGQNIPTSEPAPEQKTETVSEGEKKDSGDTDDLPF